MHEEDAIDDLIEVAADMAVESGLDVSEFIHIALQQYTKAAGTAVESFEMECVFAEQILQ